MIDSDNFNRADSTTNPGSTSGSRAWSAARGTWGISSNALYTSAVNTTGQGAILVSDFGENDVILSIDAAARASNIVQLGLVFRYVDLNNHWYWVVYRDNGANPKYFLIKRVAGVDTTVATGALANNNACTVSVEVNGSSIVGKVDGSTIASTTDSALATATSHGLNIYGSNTHTLDNFALTGGHNVSGGQATETDTANAGTPRIVVQGSMATETDTANTGTPTAGVAVQGIQATETDTANAGAPAVALFGTQATETETANAGTIVTPPLNDSFANAIDLGSATSGTIAGTIVSATEEPSEPSPSIMTDGDDLIYNTIWYKWTAPADGEATFDTRGSLAVDTVTELDTVLAAWEGAALAALVEVASNDDHDYPPTLTPDRWSRITFDVVEGTVYRIQVGGWGGAESYPNAVGSTVLNWTMTAAAAWPPRLGLFDALPL